MTRTLKIVVYSAATGFFLPILLLLLYSFANYFGYEPSTNLLFYICPPSIASMALNGASLLTSLTIWFFICLSNAVLYALPSFLFLLAYSFVRPAATPPSILK